MLLFALPVVSFLFSFSFFFSCSADHRDLHSFPTRRSSDLLLSTCRSREETPASRLRLRARRLDRPVAAADQDRKSTRLNSSHLGISYAVFCLKKKKKQKKQTPQTTTTTRHRISN